MQAFGLWLVKIVRGYWLPLLILGAMVGAFLALRTQASPVASVADVDAILRGGQPALVLLKYLKCLPAGQACRRQARA